MSEEKACADSNRSTPLQGILLGAVLDLSGSMYTNMRNKDGNQYSRIESLSKAFQQVMGDAQLFLRNTPLDDQIRLRLFIHGFGFLAGEKQTWKSSIGDLFSILTSLDEKVAHYKPLQSELEAIWLNEVEQTLEAGRVSGDAREELRLFVEHELREQAIQAEQQRSAARFQRWCASVYQRIDAYDARLRMRIAQYRRFALLILPFAVGFLSLLRGPTLILAYVNRLFEALVQRKLADFRDNANKYAMQQAGRVVTVTKKGLAEHRVEISKIIEKYMIEFIDTEAFKQIHLYDAKSSAELRKRAFNRKALKKVYESVATQISEIMSPHANLTWKTSLFLLRRAAKTLKIQPDWELLKEKTIRCAHQIIWETTTPEVSSKAKALAREHFTRAVLITIVQAIKDKERTLSLQEVSMLLERHDEMRIAMSEMPIFGSSPMGLALNQTFLRLWREAHLSQNRGLQPAIMIVSDGLPTDTEAVDIAMLAEQIKQAGIPIICCFVTNKNVGRPWLLRRKAGWLWPKAAHLMFSMASLGEEWPEFSRRLQESRFIVKKQAKLFIQINHAEYLQSVIEAILLPVESEQRLVREALPEITSR